MFSSDEDEEEEKWAPSVFKESAGEEEKVGVEIVSIRKIGPRQTANCAPDKKQAGSQYTEVKTPKPAQSSSPLSQDKSSSTLKQDEKFIPECLVRDEEDIVEDKNGRQPEPDQATPS